MSFNIELSYFFSKLELVGGTLTMYSFFSSPIALLTAGILEAPTEVLSDPEKRYVADPNTFPFASLITLILNAHFFAVDTLLAKRFKVTA